MEQKIEVNALRGKLFFVRQNSGLISEVMSNEVLSLVANQGSAAISTLKPRDCFVPSFAQ